MSEKPTLEEMADACQRQADDLRHHLTHRFYPMNPGMKHARWEHELDIWEAAALTLRVAGTYENDFRMFIAERLKRHRDGQ